MRKDTRWRILAAACFLILAGTQGRLWGADVEAQGQTAERAGKLREALIHYVAALQGAPEGGTDEQRLREQCIAIALKLKPPPAVPEEAKRFMARGQAAVEVAKQVSDFQVAIREFSHAVRTAPWWADAYYNLATVQERAERFSEAIRHYKLYLLAAPGAKDTEEVKGRIYKAEFKQELAQKPRSEAGPVRQPSTEPPRQPEFVPSSLAGRWWNSCPTGGILGNPYEIRVRGDLLEHRGWLPPYEEIAGHWNKWSGESQMSPLVYRYDPGTRTFVSDVYDVGYNSSTDQFYSRGITGKATFKIVSNDHLIEEMTMGNTTRRCEWRRQR